MDAPNPIDPPVRLKDVARSAGVSPTAASMVFNDSGRISPATRERVFEAARRLGYVHRRRRRRTAASGARAALLISVESEWSFIWHFLTPMIARIEANLHRCGFHILLIPIDHHESDDRIHDKIVQAGCRAVFSVHVGRESLFNRLESEGIPLILIMNNGCRDRFFSICTDDFQGAYEGTRHLLNLGHRRVDFVDAQRRELPMLSTDRYFGYRKALEEQGVAQCGDNRIIGRIDWSGAHWENRLRCALGRDDAPTALFCLDDELALRVWSALGRIGRSVPEDISLLAPGDVLDYTKPYIPGITTMRIDMGYVGRLAVEMLMNRRNNAVETVHVLKVKQQLVQRGSSRRLECARG